MNEIPTSDSLLWEALPDLTLNIAQTAALCGISVRQLGYWTRQGYVAAQGHGARRTYGLEAVRRVLAIRKAMDAGASLRQALRQVAVLSPLPSMLQRTPPNGTAPPETRLPEENRPPEEVAVLKRNLTTLFEANRHTRDHAGGLAVKLGLAEDDVRAAAESLCAAGVLNASVCQGMMIFRRAGEGTVYVRGNA